MHYFIRSIEIMKMIKISDATMKEAVKSFRLSFKEKIELAKLQDKLGVDFIELDAIRNEHIDFLQIKSIASAVFDSGISVTVELNKESVGKTWEAIKSAKHPRLQVFAPTSAV
jgi:2-isopropylmalate synthase